MHVATLIINGIMLTVVGDGRVPNRTIDMVETRQHLENLRQQQASTVQHIITGGFPNPCTTFYSQCLTLALVFLGFASPWLRGVRRQSASELCVFSA